MSDEQKRRAAEAALSHVEDGMRLGLGTGSTAAHFVRGLGRRVAEGLRVTGVATSKATEVLARELAVPLAPLDTAGALDLDVDGADEIGPGLALIKGGGGALLREKIVAHAAQRMIVIGDESKLVPELGAFPLPVEIVDFAVSATARAIERAAAALGLTVAVNLRQDGDAPYLTDGGNRILDASFGQIPDPEALSDALSRMPGVVEHGLFLGYADLALVASSEGVREIEA